MPARLLLLCLLFRSSWLTVEGGRQVDAAKVLHRQGGRVAVAVSVGVAGGVPEQQCQTVRLRRSRPPQVARSGSPSESLRQCPCRWGGGGSGKDAWGSRLSLRSVRRPQLLAVVPVVAVCGFVACDALPWRSFVLLFGQCLPRRQGRLGPLAGRLQVMLSCVARFSRSELGLRQSLRAAITCSAISRASTAPTRQR